MSAPNDIVVRLREEGFITHMAKLPRESKILHAAADEIEQLRKERDEARREVCVLMQRTGFLRGDYADERGWDCFKENTNDR